MTENKKKARISDAELMEIKNSFTESFGSKDKLWIFGSRADLKKKGGDLDFYVETQEEDVSIALENKNAFIKRLWSKLGEQKIDVVLNIVELKHHLPIYEIAKTKGIQIL